MNTWKVTWDPKGQYATHRVRGNGGHSLMTLTASSIFRSLRVSAALYSGTDAWWSIHSEPGLNTFEFEHGVEARRWAYNDQQIKKAVSRKKMTLGHHAGYCDLFVPIVLAGEVAAVLVTGPFATARPSSNDVLERWKWVRGRQAHPADPQFAEYLRATLATLVLDGNKLRSFERLLDCLARLIGGEGRSDELATRAYAMRVELEPARLVDRVWEAARKMVDRRSGQERFSGARIWELKNLGLRRAAEDVLVGLALSRKGESNSIDGLMRRDAFQRASVEIARETGNVLAGQVGDQGVVFLSGLAGNARKRTRSMLGLAERASNIARRRFDLALHFGVCLGSHATPLSQSYERALSAAESALAEDKRVVFASPEDGRHSHPLRDLRDELSRIVEEHPHMLLARFERYLDAVARRCDYRIESARAEIELCVDRAADALLKNGAMDPKTMAAMRDDLDRAANESRTLSELFGAYRRAISDMSDSMSRPVASRQDRSLRGALEHIAQHYAEPLSLAKVARVAGFAPKYFSKLFHKQQRTTFEQYLFEVRLERARLLLGGTDLQIGRIAELSGFRSPQNLCRVFRRAVGATPLQYRREQLPVSMRKAVRKSADQVTTKK